ncbi:MAG: LLM class flavin-dependent oxidoreductase [Chloroflexi bacterium]|nr:LLM class flavin-dependent oxidoreductase [Chloroflexota bacterium]
MPKIGVFMFQDFGYPAFVDSAKLAEENDFDFFGLIDSTDAYSDYCPWAGLVAVNTSKILIGPWVTNPLTRHPRVTANHALTIQELSRGRAMVGLGAGDNAVRSMGWKPATPSVFREAMEIIRNKFKEKKADIPIYYGGSGERNTATALRLADGITGAGAAGPRVTTDAVVQGIERLKAKAKEVGRDFNTLDIRTGMTFSLSYNRKEAIEEIKGLLARTMKGIFLDGSRPFPTELDRFREEAKKVAEAYDYFNHMRSHTPEGQLARHTKVMSDEFADAFGMAGTPSEMLPRFKVVWEAASQYPNVNLVITPHGSKGGRKRSFELFVKEILPKLRS